MKSCSLVFMPINIQQIRETEVKLKIDTFLNHKSILKTFHVSLSSQTVLHKQGFEKVILQCWWSQIV